MPVPYTFGASTSAIPLSNLDSNFATTITLGNTAIQLGNTVTTLNNMTLANVTISSGTVSITNVTVTTANVTTLNVATSIVTTSETLNYGTANGVLYLNASKVATSGTGLVFDGTSLGVGTNTIPANVKTVIASPNTAVNSRGNLYVYTTDAATADYGAQLTLGGSFSGTSEAPFAAIAGRWVGGTTGYMQFSILNSGTVAEQMRLDSTGLGIGTSSPITRLDINKSSQTPGTTTPSGALVVKNTAAGAGCIEIGSGSPTLGYIQVRNTDNATMYDMVLQPSGGNLGLGVTPSAWGSNFRALEIQYSSGASVVAGLYPVIAANTYNDNTNWLYKTTAAASYYSQVTGQHRWYTAPSGTAGNAITFTQAMTLTASGSLLLGATSLAFAEQFQMYGNYAVFNNASYTGFIGQGSTLGTATASDFAIRSSNALAFLTGGATERARIDSSGNLLVGTSGTTVTLGGNTNTSIGSVIGRIAFQAGAPANNYSAGIRSYVPSGAAGIDYADLRFYTSNGTGTLDQERARIDSSGNLLVGATATSTNFDGKLDVAGRIHTKANSGTTALHFIWNEATTGDNGFINFGTEATFTSRGSITYNRAGGVVGFNTTSDYRAKDIIGPVQNAGAIIDDLKVYMGKMKGATIERPMMIAHEAQTVTPYAVTGEKDAVNEDGTPKYQQMDHQVLVPLLIAELQSLRARVAQLEAKG